MGQFNIDRSIVGQITDSGTNSMVVGVPKAKKTLLDHLLSWYSVLGTTATIGFGWYALHVHSGWWFFWSP